MDARSDPYGLAAMLYEMMAQVHATLGDTGSGLRTLGRYEPLQDAHLQLHLRCDPPFAPMVHDRRFRALVTIPPPVWGKGC